jgi:hypothetical protein
LLRVKLVGVRLTIRGGALPLSVMVWIAGDAFVVIEIAAV